MATDTMFEDPRVRDLLGGKLTDTITGAFACMEIAEAEIAAARGGKTEKDDADPLWCAFKLMVPTHDRMSSVDYLYRSHVRELLDRVKAKKDTRPATDIELLLAISDASQAAPLAREMVALMMRLFERALPEQFEGLDLPVHLYVEEKRFADEWDGKMRAKGAQDWRKS